MKIVIINGPNLGRLGRRKVETYGLATQVDILTNLACRFQDYEVALYQSNSEGEIIDLIEKYGYNHEVKGIIINPGAYTHYSFAIADAIEAAMVPFVEVHITNIAAREDFRRKSVTARHCIGVISGFGIFGYELAALALVNHSEK